MSSPAVGCRGYADLARQQVEGTDYKVHVRANAQSSIAVIAPHGGGIEGYTSEIARAIASDELRSESEPVLHEIADAWKAHPEWTLIINGHTDNSGGDALDLDLSRRRDKSRSNASPPM